MRSTSRCVANEVARGRRSASEVPATRPASNMVAMSDRASSANEPIAPEGWHLRSASLADVDGVHRLASEPLVYRTLFDAVAPGRHRIAQAITQATRDAGATALGLWILAGPRVA